jgi:hypothetical protein
VAVIDRCMTPVGARNEFAEPRDRKPKSRLSRSQPAAKTGGPAFERAEIPANWGSFVRDLETPVRIGVRGGGCSACLTCLFPANLGKQGEFGEMQGEGKWEAAKKHEISIRWIGFSLLKEQGAKLPLAGRVRITITEKRAPSLRTLGPP